MEKHHTAPSSDFVLTRLGLLWTDAGRLTRIFTVLGSHPGRVTRIFFNFCWGIFLAVYVSTTHVFIDRHTEYGKKKKSQEGDVTGSSVPVGWWDYMVALRGIGETVHCSAGHQGRLNFDGFGIMDASCMEGRERDKVRADGT
jgi:hypothetical protein